MIHITFNLHVNSITISHMYKFIALTLVFITFFVVQAESQNCTFIAIESTETLPNEQVCLDFIMTPVEDVTGFQWTNSWNSEIIEFDTILNVNPILNEGSFIYNDQQAGETRLTWVTFPANPIIPKLVSSHLFTVCFTAQDTLNVDSQVLIDPNGTTPLEIVYEDFSSHSFCSSEATIDITDTPSSNQDILLHGFSQDNNCEIGQDGSIDAFAFFGSEPYQFVWGSPNGFNSTNQNINGLNAGLYFLTVVDNNGNAAVDSFEIFEIGTPTLPIPSFTRPECADDSTGIIDISPTFGTAPYTYAWSNFTFEEDLTNVPPGTYDVTVTDSNGCEAVGSWILNYSNYHILSVNVGGSACPSAMDGFIDVFANPDAANPLIYTWSNGETTEDLSNIPPGIYHLSVTDANDCLNTYEFEIAGLPIPTVTKNMYCPSFGASDGNVEIELSFTQSDFQFVWEDGSISSTGTRTQLSAGNYAFTVVDGSNCQLITDSFSLASTIEDYKFDYFSCGLDSIALEVNATSMTDSFNWYPVQNFDHPTSEDAILLSPDFDFSGGTPPPFQFTLTTIATSGCQSISDFVLTPQEDCVWPGDANNDNMVSAIDILNIALANGSTGSPRSPQSSEWFAQPSTDWGNSIPGTSLDERFADCDGNGMIEGADTNVVLQNLGRSHYQFTSSIGNNRAMEIPLSINIPVEFSATDQNQFEILLGDDTNTLDDAYGVAFQLLFDETLVEGEKGKVIAAGWLANGNTPWSINIDDIAPGILDVVLTRNDGTAASGFGAIGNLYLPFKSFSGNMPVALEIRNATLVTSSGEYLSVEGSPTSSTLLGTSVGTNDLASRYSELIFPNPSNGILNISSNRTIESINIKDIRGKLIYNKFADDKIINISQFPQGTYIIKLIGSEGISSHKFIKVD